MIIEKEDFFKIFGEGKVLPESEYVFTPKQDFEVLIAFIKTFHIESVLEIGIQSGYTAELVLKNASFVKQYIGIDLLPDSHTTLTNQEQEIPNEAGIRVKHDNRVTIITAPRGTRDINPSILPKCQLVYIDGDHSAQGVAFDYKFAKQVIMPGGIICWHDYNNLIGVNIAIERINAKEGDSVIHVKDTHMCFKIMR